RVFGDFIGCGAALFGSHRGRFALLWSRGGNRWSCACAVMMVRRGKAPLAVVAGYGSVSIQCSEQGGREGAGLRSGALPRRCSEARLCRTLRPACARRSCDGCRRIGPSGSLRRAHRQRRPLSPDCGRHVIFHSRRWSVSETGSGWPHHDDRFRARAHGDRQRSGIRRAWPVLPDVGAGAASRLWGGSARAVVEAAPAGVPVSGGRCAMTSGSDGNGERHIPVLLQPVLAALQPAPGRMIVDGTFGAGGYTTAILEQGANVVAIDRDPDAIAAGAALVARFDGRLRLMHGPFSRMEELVGDSVDGVVLDIGVSSMQLDEAERGFSFRFDGPLDMRMAQAGLTAADVVNRFKVSDLIRIFGMLGEERHAGRIARAIERVRADRPFETTSQLAELVEKTIGRKPGDKIHPATRVFQGLRIFVNDELGELGRALFAAERLLKPGGVLAVVTFHSLEDRMVK